MAAGLGKQYRRTWALRDCTLTVPEGHVVGLVGPNGEAVAEHGLSVVMSSHPITDLERVSDYLIVLVSSQVRVAGEVGSLLASHQRLSGPRRDTSRLPASQEIITESHTDKQSSLLVRTDEPVLDPSWTVRPVSLEDLVLAYMSQARAETTVRRPQLGVVS